MISVRAMQYFLKLDRHHTFLVIAVFISLVYNVVWRERYVGFRDNSVVSILTQHGGLEEQYSITGDVLDCIVGQDGGSVAAGESISAQQNKGVYKNEDGVYEVTLVAGDTLYKVLHELGVSSNNAYLVAAAVNKVYKVAGLKADSTIYISNIANNTVVDMVAHPASLLIGLPDARVKVEFDTNRKGYDAALIPLATFDKKHFIASRIKHNFFYAAKKNGAMSSVIMDFIKLFSYDVDFQRDLDSSASFKVLYSYKVDENGKRVSAANILYAVLVTKGQEREIYRYDFADGTYGYFYKDGTSIKRALLKTPIKSASISSGYGMRKHPILGYSRMHRGLDYAAPRGTPILAAGDGVVEIARQHNTYGKYVKIKHNKRYATLYAHLDRFASKLRAGQVVKQGEVIGYVGSSGMSTGPHLHYEVHVDGKQVNPAKANMVPNVQALTGKQLEAFRAHQILISNSIRDSEVASIANEVVTTQAQLSKDS